MQYITTTELRTKSKELIRALKNGDSVHLIHRSKVVGIIRPYREPKPLTAEGIKRIRASGEKLNLPKLSYKERDKIYRKHLLEKYGRSISKK